MTDEDYELESDHEYLFDLAEKLRHVAPMHSNTDGGDVDRLREIAGKLRDALKVDLTDEEDDGAITCAGENCVYATTDPSRAGWQRQHDGGWQCGWCVSASRD